MTDEDEPLDDIVFAPDEVALDQRSAALVTMAKSCAEVEAWSAVEHRRRLADEIQAVEAQARERSAFVRRQTLVQMRAPVDGVEGEVEAIPEELARERQALLELRQRLDAEARGRRIREIRYQLSCGWEQAEAWWRWEVGGGPKPDLQLAPDDDVDDAELDNLVADANGDLQIRRPGKRR